jgi:hypothetical protein
MIDLLCPLCTARLELVTDGRIITPMIPAVRLPDARPIVESRRVPFLACTGCEFCVEVRTRNGQITAIVHQEAGHAAR